MKYLDRLGFPMTILILLLFSCENPPKNPQLETQTSETRNLVFVPIDKDKKDSSDVSQLNQWTELYPDKRIVSFSSVIDPNKAVVGYMILFVPGSSSNQRFVRIERYDLGANKEDPVQHGMTYLQAWLYENPATQIIGFTTIPDTSGRVEAFMLCFETETTQEQETSQPQNGE